MGGARSEYLKLIDFGTAKYFQEVKESEGSEMALSSCKDTEVARPVVSLGYTAPEVSRAADEYVHSRQTSIGAGHNPFANDVYSLGTILFMMITGTQPNKNGRALNIHNQMHGKVDTEFMSDEVKALILRMTSGNPQERPTINGVLADPWFSADEIGTEALPGQVFNGPSPNYNL